MFEKILVATDFSDSSRTAWFAGFNLASRCMAKVNLLHVFTYMEYVFSPDNYAVPDERWFRRLMDEMDTQYPSRLYPNSQRTVTSSTSIPDGILEYANREACDLIVVGTHGRKALSRILMGSVTQELIRNSPVPVMVVKAVKKPEEHVQNYDRVLIPIDFSEVSMKALNYGIRFANFLRADVHLIHIVDTPAISNLRNLYLLPDTMMTNTEDLNVDLTLSKALTDKEIVGHQKVATLFGDPAEEILNYAAKNNCGFIVMGTHGRKGLERTLLGSVTAVVASKSEVPVITISPLKSR